MEERTEHGTLKCICGKRGLEFIHVEGTSYQGVCSEKCREEYHRNKSDQQPEEAQ